MAYDKNTWKSGDVVTSAKLNNIENGIANCNGAITATKADSRITLSASYNDVISMISTGIVPFTVIEDEGIEVILVCAYYWVEDDTYDVSFSEIYKSSFYDFVASSADELLSCDL